MAVADRPPPRTRRRRTSASISAPPPRCPVASAAPRYRARPALRLRGVLRPARGRLRLPARPSTRCASDRGRPAQHLALRAAAARSRRRGRQARTSTPAAPSSCKADNLARELGRCRRALCVKDDTGNPTHSFKDRVVAVAARGRPRASASPPCPARRPATSPTPSAPRPPAPGFRSCVFIPHDLEQGKIVMTAVYGGDAGRVEGNYDDVNRFCSELVGDPRRGLGLRQRQPAARTTRRAPRPSRYEIAEQLGWRLPDAGRRSRSRPARSSPRSTRPSGADQARPGRGHAVQDLRRPGRRAARRCPPAFKAGHDVVRPVQPDTIAKSLAIGNPADGPYVLDIVPAHRRGGRGRHRRARSSRRSGCWPGPRASSPRPRAG